MVVIGYLFPALVIQPLRDAFETVGNWPSEVASTLRTSPWKTFWRIKLPLARPGFLSAAIFRFFHTVGVFGVVQMIGGNLPDKTAVISTTIMTYVEADHFVKQIACA